MDLEPKTQARILKLFEHKICSVCGAQAERAIKKKTYCQKCFLIQKLEAQKEHVSEPRIFVDPFPESSLGDEQEMNEFIYRKGADIEASPTSSLY